MKQKFHTIEAEQLAHLHEPETLLLDCRKLKDYQSGHIDNALHSHDSLIESLLRKGDKSRKIIIYCYHGHSSEHLAELFAGFGFNNIFNLQGGYEAWTQYHSTRQSESSRLSADS